MIEAGSEIDGKLAGLLDSAKRLMVVKPSSLGDVVHALPAVEAVHRHRPALELHWVVNEEWAPILEGNPALTSLIRFPRKQMRGMSGLGKFWNWSRCLADCAPDVVIDFQGLLRSGLMAYRSGAPVRVGPSESREGARFFYSHQGGKKLSQESHAVDRCFAIVERCGVPRPPRDEVVFPLPQRALRDELAAELPSEPFVVFHPFSRGQGKSIEPHMLQIFCAAVEPFPVVLVGQTSTDIALSEKAVNLLNRTNLVELTAILGRAAFTVSVDSGPMHLAAALGSNVLSLHTWTDPQSVGPYPEAAWVWKNEKIARVGDAPPEWRADRLPARLDEDAVLAVGVWVRDWLRAC